MPRSTRDEVDPKRPQCPSCADAHYEWVYQDSGRERPREIRLGSGACGAISRGGPMKPRGISRGNARGTLGGARRRAHDANEIFQRERPEPKALAPALLGGRVRSAARRYILAKGSRGLCSTLGWKPRRKRNVESVGDQEEQRPRR